jgi:hypothetical protein
MAMTVDKPVKELLALKEEVLRETLLQCRSVHHKSHIT